jgi:hypothetical protein
VLSAIRLCRRKAKDNISSSNLEFLDDAALRQELERVGKLFGGHGRDERTGYLRVKACKWFEAASKKHAAFE